MVQIQKHCARYMHLWIFDFEHWNTKKFALVFLQWHFVSSLCSKISTTMPLVANLAVIAEYIVLRLHCMANSPESNKS